MKDRLLTPHDALPNVYRARLDDAELLALLDEIGSLVDILELRQKSSETHRAAASTNWQAARSAFEDSRIQGLQVIYQYQDETWSDTLTRREQAVDLTRIQLG